MEEIKFVETTAAELPAAQAKKPRKKAKPQAEEVVMETMPETEMPPMQQGVIVYRNEATDVLGFECDGHGYQVPGAKELGYKLGDKVDFMVVDGKIVFGIA